MDCRKCLVGDKHYKKSCNNCEERLSHANTIKYKIMLDQYSELFGTLYKIRRDVP